MPATPKPAKGSGWIERRERRKAVEAHESEQKRAVRLRDHVCRWPRCQNCRRYRPRLEVAHIQAKGIGGDHGQRSDASGMVLLDRLTHQGPDGLEQHGRRIVPLTPAGANGPCEFWRKDEDGQLYLVAREIAIGVYERD